MLNVRIREEVWGAFLRGHFEVAAGVAVQAVETAVREACGPLKEKAGKEQYGKALTPWRAVGGRGLLRTLVGAQ